MARKRSAARARYGRSFASPGRMLLGSRFLGLTRSRTSTLTRVFALPTAGYQLVMAGPSTTGSKPSSFGHLRRIALKPAARRRLPKPRCP